MGDMKTAADMLAESMSIVAGSREQTHGDKFQNFTKISYVWNGILMAAGKPTASPLDAHDVANLMEGMKMARRYLGAFNPDDYIDGAGYAACGFEIRTRANDKG